MSDTNCPFYGRNMFVDLSHANNPFHRAPFILIPQQSNQCGLVATSFAACWMEVNKHPVEWANCPLVREVRMEKDDD